MLQMSGAEIGGGNKVREWNLNGCIPQVHGTETSGYFSTFWETLTSGATPKVDTFGWLYRTRKRCSFLPI
jgi:hypothetical protein